MPVDVTDLGVDFLALSGHKMLGPSGIGALWGRRELLEAMPPFLTGGSMISKVTLTGTDLGRGAAQVRGGHAGDRGGRRAWLQQSATSRRSAWRTCGRTSASCSSGPGPRSAQSTGSGGSVPTRPDEHAGVISFVIEGVHPHDVATVLDHHGVAVRAGHHCAQPVMARYDLPATTRASFYVYNDLDDVERLAEAIHAAQRLFRTG